jgi:alkanesulfonate monooxygenase SsuD/methylene tetrahydromethanopterin reductase-like flavin-dependent oxidoreductase (luciferase family)
MYFGYGAPTRPPLGTAANTRRIAEKAEEVGLSYVSIADHILPPLDEEDPYPYTADGSTPWDDSGNVLECLTLAAYIAGFTRKLRVVTGVMVVPLRNPLITAKALANQSPDTIRKTEHIHSILIASLSPLKLTTMGG